jgi:hypothetical protein
MSVTWSHSSLKDYEGCPRRYHEVRVLKRAKQKDTSQTLYGTAVHAAAENYVKDKTPIPEEFNFMYPVVEHVLAKGPIHHPEYEMALDIGCSPCAWDSKDKWVRGIVDLLVIDPENYTAWLVDYKTGGQPIPRHRPAGPDGSDGVCAFPAHTRRESGPTICHQGHDGEAQSAARRCA